jgi:hypothetical protein
MSLVMVQVKDIRAANACKVIPAKFSGPKEIVPLHIQRTVSLIPFLVAGGGLDIFGY